MPLLIWIRNIDVDKLFQQTLSVSKDVEENL